MCIILDWKQASSSVEGIFARKDVIKLHISQSLRLFLIAVLVWALWHNRNKMAIEKKFPSSTTVIMYDAISFMQSWGLLLKTEESKGLKNILELMKCWIHIFQPAAGDDSDIAVL